MCGKEILGFLPKGAFKNTNPNEGPPASCGLRSLPSSPHWGLEKCNAIPLPSTQALPSETAFSQHGVIRRKISSCQVGANQNSTNKP